MHTLPSSLYIAYSVCSRHELLRLVELSDCVSAQTIGSNTLVVGRGSIQNQECDAFLIDVAVHVHPTNEEEQKYILMCLLNLEYSVLFVSDHLEIQGNHMNTLCSYIQQQIQ